MKCAGLIGFELTNGGDPPNTPTYRDAHASKNEQCSYDDDVKFLLSKRETLCNVSAVFHVIRGAYELWTEHQSQNLKDFNSSRSCYRNELRQHLDVKDGHMKVLIKLLRLGVDVNERDVGGQIHCFIVLEMA